MLEYCIFFALSPSTKSRNGSGLLRYCMKTEKIFKSRLIALLRIRFELTTSPNSFCSCNTPMLSLKPDTVLYHMLAIFYSLYFFLSSYYPKIYHFKIQTQDLARISLIVIVDN